LLASRGAAGLAQRWANWFDPASSGAASMTPAILLAFTLACIVIVIVPGPTVTVIVANSLRDGARAGLANVAGTQAGLAFMILVVAFGLQTVVEVMAHWFDWLKLAGAAYLVWLGIRMLRSTGDIGQVGKVRPPRGGYFLQGLLVIWSNPKALLFFGAFIPQFIDPAGDAFWQTVICGLIFMATATIFDSAYALVAGRAGRLLTRTRVRFVERISGALLIFGGLWIATMRRA
jgi:homoserine/homoserine lactone efflux protein